jgi:hypothetical protein
MPVRIKPVGIFAHDGNAGGGDVGAVEIERADGDTGGALAYDSRHDPLGKNRRKRQ